ncbi:hypothetical protein [Polluticaenibacter yanchengensis]|uniref:Uncharacterized protein n=1 Tax=Polluticaenibacter yanchengensis TaxID=3014562 RepID=A0ABT4UM08_9BACT|nr:hypothetical protein [Chitinophagaceae bacterium LY-5]
MPKGCLMRSGLVRGTSTERSEPGAAGTKVQPHKTLTAPKTKCLENPGISYR